MKNIFRYLKNTRLLLLVIPFISSAQLVIPHGYTMLTKSPANGKPMEQRFLDFDGDGEEDTALIVENNLEFSAYKFMLYVSSLNKTYEVDLICLQETSIYPVPIKLRKNVLEFGYYEDGTATFGRFIKLRFQPKNNQIQVIGYDVSYKASPTYYIDKSYNLLTGKYTVKGTTYDTSNKVKVEEYLGDNDFFKNAVFIENLNESMIIDLDDVGSTFE
mgnify:CR=1 FL=1